MKHWTTTEIETLRELYKTKTRKQISAIMGIPVDMIRGALNRYNITSGRITQFKLSNQPWNAGLPARTNPAGEFKPGNQPHNTLYDGAVRKRSNGYYYTRIARGKWMLWHRHIFMQHHGPIPAGKSITFVDGNPLNCDISNLMLTTNQQLVRSNSNPAKAGRTIKALYDRERLRKKYNIGPLSGHYNRLKSA